MLKHLKMILAVGLAVLSVGAVGVFSQHVSANNVTNPNVRTNSVANFSRVKKHNKKIPKNGSKFWRKYRNVKLKKSIRVKEVKFGKFNFQDRVVRTKNLRKGTKVKVMFAGLHDWFIKGYGMKNNKHHAWFYNKTRKTNWMKLS